MSSYADSTRLSPPRPTVVGLVILIALSVSLVGCLGGAPHLPDTPHVLLDGSGPEILSKINPELQKPEMQVLYVTDRAKYGQNGDWPLYGYDRSPNVAFGTATVSFKPTPTWEELCKASGTKEGGKWELSVFSLREKGSVQVSPESLEVREGSIRFKPEFAAGIEEQKKEFQKHLQERLALTPKKDVYLYVHGVDNYFESPILRIATVWHFIGRQGVPVAYSWPAGRGGLLGYFYDRESGEFTIINLKRTLKTIASTPGVERVHLIGHSRGGDITTTALRELNLEYQAKGLDPRKELKLETLVLAAPDLDASVFSTRLLYENMAGIANQIVVYSSSKDKAVGLADKLFHSKNRLGTLSEETIKPGGKKILADLATIQLVRCDVSGFGTSHDYPFTHPSALSDLILVLRDGRQPGKENGRPLTHLGGAFWMLDNNYKIPEPAAVASH